MVGVEECWKNWRGQGRLCWENLEASGYVIILVAAIYVYTIIACGAVIF
jgi:hypothetical protein